MADQRGRADAPARRARTLVAGFVAHGFLLAALLVAMASLLISSGGAGMHTNGPLIVGAYVAATIAVTGAMVWHLGRRR